MPDDATISMEYRCTCDECGEELTAQFSTYIHAGHTVNAIEVEPCDTCLEKARDEVREA